MGKLASKVKTIFTNKYSKVFIVLLIASFVFYAFFVYVEKKDQKDSVRFGFITDVHCYSKFNKDESRWETNWRCSRPLGEFVQQMNNSSFNSFNPDFVIENGDFVDGRDKLGEDGFLKAQSMYEKINTPNFYVLGNHETSNFTKERWMELTGHERTYYYFDLKGYRFIVLDGNNTYDDVENPKEIVDMEPWMEPHSYKGMMDEEQMKWLKTVLNNSGDLKKIVFIHEPPLDETIGESRDDIFINPKPLRELFSEYKVKAVFSGHIEEICDVEVEGVKYFTFQGFHKKSPRLEKENQYKDKGVFHQITINEEGKIDIEMFFSEDRESPYQSIKINQETAVCNNSNLPQQN
jgi:hypothetical protein